MELYYLLLLIISQVYCYPKYSSPTDDTTDDTLTSLKQDGVYYDALERSIDKLGDDISAVADILDFAKDDIATDTITDINSNDVTTLERNTQEDITEEYHNNNNEEKRIVDGKKARKGGFPWQVAIYFANKLICGGTLLSMKYIMTAAHCFGALKSDGSNLKDYRVRLGEYNRKSKIKGGVQVRDLKNVKLHEKYQDGDIHANDIAIITLEREGTQLPRIYPACLGTETLQKGHECVLTGWGRDYAWGETKGLLHELTTPIVTQADCIEQNAGGKLKLKVTDKMLCTGSMSEYASGCMGDSGGPLSCKQQSAWKVYGVVSWGSNQCNGLDKYTVYTKVASYIDWIKKAAGGIKLNQGCFREDP